MDHSFYMSLAYEEALKAKDVQEVPVGSLIVKDDQIISRAYNQKEQKQMISAHAELLAISFANLKLKSWRLEDCRIYTTLEPCEMCAGAILGSRIGHLIYGCSDIHRDRPLSYKAAHKIEVTSGVMEEECATLIKDFFKDLRSKKE